LIVAPGRQSDVRICIGIGIVAAVFFGLLGSLVSHRPPNGIDAASRSIAGEAPGLAWIFTASCLWPTLTILGLIGCAAAVRLRAWRGRIIFAIAVTLVGWQTSDVLKNLFARPRPAYWVLHHETSFAYSSGHAMFATLVYWLWAYHVARAEIYVALRGMVSGFLAIWGAGVLWSRLALGAHYPTDLVGGVLLAIALLALAKTIATIAIPRVRVL
jgi:undecaprenyl-diphosphatase